MLGFQFQSTAMTTVLVLYYSTYGHVEAMANAVAEGARVGAADATVKRVPELVPIEIARKSGFKLDQTAAIATVGELPDYDAIIFGSLAFKDLANEALSQLREAGADKRRM